MVKYDNAFKTKFKAVLRGLDEDQYVEYIDSMISSDGDKCESFEHIAVEEGLPLWSVPVVYMIGKMIPKYKNRIKEEYMSHMDLYIFYELHNMYRFYWDVEYWYHKFFD